jgi:ATP-binding cassette, subfamily F, member 3
LAQDPELDENQPALESALAGSERVMEIEAHLASAEARLSDPQVYNDLAALSRTLERQQTLLTAYDALGGLTYQSRTREVLKGLGLKEADWPTPVGRLSGGQKKLVGLARLIMARPPVLLLDEPDNHLDLAGKAYLERLINGYPGAVVIVSHDRYLLDAVVTHIAHLEQGRLDTFAGDYSSYAVDRERRLARQDELYRVQQREIARLEASAKRLIIWGRQYDNNELVKKGRVILGRLERMERIERPVLEQPRMQLNLGGWRGSTKVLELAGVSKGYNGRPVLHDLSLEVRHGERVGLIGPNGVGKSLLLRLVLGEEQPDAGEVKIGPSVHVGYYAQEHETLDYTQTPMEALRRVARVTEGGAVAYLMRHLFTYQQVSQPIGELSGGERSRLQLALLAAPGDARPNFLLLDEPTNNLDIASAEVLESALEEFAGTVLVISHDRYFLDRAVSRLIVLGRGRAVQYPGGYSDFLVAQERGSEGTYLV